MNELIKSEFRSKEKANTNTIVEKWRKPEDNCFKINTMVFVDEERHVF